jgi:hypothetical protein
MYPYTARIWAGGYKPVTDQREAEAAVAATLGSGRDCVQVGPSNWKITLTSEERLTVGRLGILKFGVDPLIQVRRSWPAEVAAR